MQIKLAVSHSHGILLLLLRSPAICLGFTILLLLRSPAICLGFTILLLLLLLLLRSPAISLGFTILLLLRPQLYHWDSPFFFFFFYIPQLYVWGSPFFFFFCVPSCISGVHHSSSSASPAISLGFTILLLLLRPRAICLGFTILLLRLRSPAITLGFTILLLLRPQLYVWNSPFFFFFCVPSYISGIHHFSSSSTFPSYMSGVHNSSSSSSSAFPAICLGFTILLLLLFLRSPAVCLEFTILLLLRSQLYHWGSPFGVRCLRM